MRVDGRQKNLYPNYTKFVEETLPNVDVSLLETIRRLVHGCGGTGVTLTELQDAVKRNQGPWITVVDNLKVKKTIRLPAITGRRNGSSMTGKRFSNLS